MKNIVLSLFAITIVTLVSHSAYACSYYIDKAAKGKELTQVAEASVAQGKDRIKVTQTTVNDLSYFESKPTTMCPEEMTYNAEIEMTYEAKMGPEGSNQLSSRCRGTLKVTKIEKWDASKESQYMVSGAQGFRCTRQ